MQTKTWNRKSIHRLNLRKPLEINTHSGSDDFFGPTRYAFMAAAGLLEPVIFQARYPKGRDGTQQDGRYLRNL